MILVYDMVMLERAGQVAVALVFRAICKALRPVYYASALQSQQHADTKTIRSAKIVMVPYA